MTADQTKARRDALVNAIIAETKPEKTGTFSFDYFGWEDGSVLHLGGDHGTPDFTLIFYEGGKVMVSPDSNTSCTKVVETDYSDTPKLAKDILATITVIMLVGSL